MELDFNHIGALWNKKIVHCHGTEEQSSQALEQQ